MKSLDTVNRGPVFPAKIWRAPVQKPRVAIAAGLFPTVSETFVLNHVTGLLDLGYDVDIYAFMAEQLESFGHAALDEYRLQERVTYLSEEIDRDELADVFRARAYCAVHVHFGHVAERFSFLKARLENVPFVVTFHGIDIRRAFAEGPEMLHETFDKFDHIISICEFNRVRLQKLGCNPAKLVDLPNGVNTSMLVPGRKPQCTAVRIVTVARLHFNKNIPFAIRTMHRLHELGLDFHYTVAGHGPERPAIEQLITELGLRERVTLLGQCSQAEVTELLAEADIFFLPSRAEASPLCVLEALACEVPVVATRVGGIDEVVRDSVNGYTVESDNDAAAAASLLRLARDSEQRQMMGRAGRRLVLGDHEARALLRRCAALYAQMPTPGLSIIMIVRDGEEVFAESMESVLHQSYQDFELIVINGDSGDATAAVIEDFARRYPGAIRHHRVDTRCCVAAREQGIKLSRSQRVLFLDPAERWHPDELARVAGGR